MMSFKPMLACAPGPVGVTVFPVLATPKIDGIRALLIEGALVSRTLKPIPNIALRSALESVLPGGCDGEIMYGDTFQSCTSAVMTRDGPKSGFTYYAFDYVGEGGTGLSELTPYHERISHFGRLMSDPLQAKLTKSVESIVRIVVLLPVSIKDAAALDAFEGKVLDSGFEGAMVRRPDGRYKHGRSTAREGLLIKIKRFEDAEATVTGADELVHNKDVNTDQPSKLLGALVAVRPDGVTFRIGTGFSAEQRRELWATRKGLLGKIVKYKFFRIGTAEAPRFPTFLGFRDPQDM